MARNTPLAIVRSMIKAETQKSLDSNATVQDTEINQIIFDVQQWLASEFDWPFLHDRWDVTVPAHTRYIPYPTTNDDGVPSTINFERAGDLRVFIKWNQVWQDVLYGIRELEEFNYMDSDRNMLLDPIQRWAFDDQSQFEVWPLPATSSLLRFIGQRAVKELRQTPVTAPIAWNDNALLDIDDLLVTYFTSAEYLTKKEKDAAAKVLLAKAENRMRHIRATYPRIQKPIVIGGQTLFDRRALRVVPMVVVAGQQGMGTTQKGN